jgi:hypothetical protein
MRGTPELAPPLPELDFDGLDRPYYRAFPLVDTVSSRVKDLSHIALIARGQSMSGWHSQPQFSPALPTRG